jgi:hypothetical protein
LDVGHVDRFLEVLFPWVSHWSKGKGTMEEGFNNGRLERRASLVNLRRLEPPRRKTFGKGRFLERWSRQRAH